MLTPRSITSSPSRQSAARETSSSAIKGYLDQEKKEADEAAGITQQPPLPPPTGPKANAPAKVTLPKGRPRIVYWTEF